MFFSATIKLTRVHFVMLTGFPKAFSILQSTVTAKLEIGRDYKEYNVNAWRKGYNHHGFFK